MNDYSQLTPNLLKALPPRYRYLIESCDSYSVVSAQEEGLNLDSIYKNAHPSYADYRVFALLLHFEEDQEVCYLCFFDYEEDGMFAYAGQLWFENLNY